MTVTLLQPTSPEGERLYVQREELVERIGRAIRADGTPSAPMGQYSRSQGCA
jgi:hypothetical protein